MINPFRVNPNFYYTRQQLVKNMQISEASFSKYFLMQVPEYKYGKRVKYLGDDINQRIDELINSNMHKDKSTAYIDFRELRDQYLHKLPILDTSHRKSVTYPVYLADGENFLNNKITTWNFTLFRNQLNQYAVYNATNIDFKFPCYKLLTIDTQQNFATAIPTACLSNTFDLDAFCDLAAFAQTDSYLEDCLSVLTNRINQLQLLTPNKYNKQLARLISSYETLKTF